MMNNDMNNMELNIKELEQVDGGNGFCFILGLTNHTEAGACAYHGTSTRGLEDDSMGGGALACVFYFGVGLGVVQNNRVWNK